MAAKRRVVAGIVGALIALGASPAWAAFEPVVGICWQPVDIGFINLLKIQLGIGGPAPKDCID